MDRVELQGPWPPHAPRGECVVSRFLDDQLEWRLRVDRADPRTTISAELLQMIAGGEGAPGVSLADGVLRIEAVNRTVIYRIGEYLAPINGYVAEWPD